MATLIESNDTGTFSDGEIRPWTAAQEGVGSVKIIKFSPGYTVPPTLSWGLCTVDLPSSAHYRISSYIDPIGPTCMSVHLDPIDGSLIYNSAMNWFETKDREFQTGVQAMTWGPLPGSNPSRSGTPPVFIRFDRPYNKPPRVVVWLAGFQISEKFNPRIFCFASDISEWGFMLHAETWSDTSIDWTNLTWIAYPTDKLGVTSAICDTRDVRPSDQTQIQEVSEPIPFQPGTFKAANGPIKVIVGLNSFDMGGAASQANFRLDTSVSNITVNGFTWHAKSWATTTMYSGGVSWIAFQPNLLK